MSVQFWKTKSFKKILLKNSKIKNVLWKLHIDLMYIKYNKAKNNILCEWLKQIGTNLRWVIILIIIIDIRIYLKCGKICASKTNLG